MNVLIAPDKFKGSIDSISLCDLLRKEIVALYPDAHVHTFPLADGGDGFASIIQYYFHTVEVETQTVNALGTPIRARYQFASESKTAYIEMASASGLAMLKNEARDIMRSSTYGTGLMIRDAIARGAAKIILGIGGSATNDGGIGMADALGFMFLDRNGDPLDPCGESLGLIEDIVMPETDILEDIEFQVACDVKNPLFGPDGAAYVYGPQKGASSEEVQILDDGLKHLDQMFMKYFGRSVAEELGSGAAGGLGAGCAVFLGARLLPGVEQLIDSLGLEDKIKQANVIITGEGCLDE
ncbi:MAG: hypothetical protein RL131_1308, partial [Bacteroidota bacterium]